MRIQKAVQLAQEADAMGFGLGGNSDSDSAMFSEFLDLTWPPRGRIIERDCTCDLWDTIQCECVFHFDSFYRNKTGAHHALYPFGLHSFFLSFELFMYCFSLDRY
jgi:hypothetical protein